MTHSPAGDNEGRFETSVLVGQASCLSFLDKQAGCLSHHFCPKYVTEFMKRSTKQHSEEAEYLMRIAVFGTGGVGGYFGGRLAHAGEDVVFIARGEHLRALRADGLRVDSPDGDFTVFPAQAAEDPREVGPVDAVILGVKAWQVGQAAEAMRPLIGPATFVVPLQNGVEAPSQLAAVLGTEHVFGGFCYIVSFIVGPGRIKHGGMKPYIAFGELDNRPSERGQRLLDAFSKAGVTAEMPPDIHAAMWGKFLFIASLSGVGAVTRAPAGVMRTLPETRQMLEEAVKEIARGGKGPQDQSER